MACAYLTDLANSIWLDIGQPTDTPVSYIQSKLVSPAFLGKLNTLTANCFQVVQGDIVPPLGNEEQGIYAAIYVIDFYTRKINALLNGTDIDFITIADGDSRITRSSTVDKARLLRDMQAEAFRELKNLISAYRLDHSNARSVDYYSIDNGWNGLFLNGGNGFIQG